MIYAIKINVTKIIEDNVQISENDITNKKRTETSEWKLYSSELLKFFKKEDIDLYISKSFNVKISKKQKMNRGTL